MELQQLGRAALQSPAELVIKVLGGFRLLALHRDRHGKEAEGKLDDVHGEKGVLATLTDGGRGARAWKK